MEALQSSSFIKRDPIICCCGWAGGIHCKIVELFSRFEFDCRRCEKYFLEGFEFLASITCNETLHVHVLWPLHPRNSISKVVVSLTIHDVIYIYIYIYILFSKKIVYTYKGCGKNRKPLWKVNGFFNQTSWKVSDVQIVGGTWVLVVKDKTNRGVADSLHSVPQESWS